MTVDCYSSDLYWTCRGKERERGCFEGGGECCVRLQTCEFIHFKVEDNRNMTMIKCFLVLSLDSFVLIDVSTRVRKK